MCRLTKSWFPEGVQIRCKLLSQDVLLRLKPSVTFLLQAPKSRSWTTSKPNNCTVQRKASRLVVCFTYSSRSLSSIKWSRYYVRDAFMRDVYGRTLFTIKMTLSWWKKHSWWLTIINSLSQRLDATLKAACSVRSLSTACTLCTTLSTTPWSTSEHTLWVRTPRSKTSPSEILTIAS